MTKVMGREMIGEVSSVLVTSIVAALVGLAVWFVQSRVEAIRQARDRLRDERREIYSTILEPYIRLMTGIAGGKDSKEAIRQARSFDYRKAAFELALVGSDEVVRAFNDLMHTFYRADAEDRVVSPEELLSAWGKMLLAIRKNIGEPNTKLHYSEMLRGQVKDPDMLFE